MEVAQVRLPEQLEREVDKLVEKGFYTNKSDVIRDAVRRLVLEKQIGSISSNKNSVAEVKKARKRLSKGKFSLAEINRLGH